MARSGTTIDDRLARFPLLAIGPAHQRITYRSAGKGLPLVMLHGIGGGSGSWLPQLETLARRFQVIAWDAPGYGHSSLIGGPTPIASDYADALDRLVDALAIEKCLLVGQSLGALIATAFARARPYRLHGLLLLGPAGGYGGATQAKRDEILTGRLNAMATLGPEGMAAQRTGPLLAPDASNEAHAIVAASMRKLRPDGYGQAARLLVNGQLINDARHVRSATMVGCGTADQVTPEAGCRTLASAFSDWQYRAILGAGHASNVDQPVRVNQLIGRFADFLDAR
ncbi:MAG: alpha/beta fold hydrolase [Burkholderiales bacterium]